MAEIHYKIIQDDLDPLLDRVKPLFSAMYREMKGMGLMLPLADDGADRWLESVLPTLGRFGIMAVASENNQLTGFAHGALKFLPGYLGNYKVGVITHIYVKESFRHQKVGQQLVKMLEKWFAGQQVHSVELQVIAGNVAKSFWEKAGYGPELIQYRKLGDKKL